ncbi:uncharacterized protein LOC110186932 [Drosophila serrata]|uniref:uncharacterized protein LOC110186932 n=1 Tax=Drosophila serrata TaxID=7274 RepID=UPI000A1D0AB4|nr:uncharacterized protein LOC110186932 [Drosophila serrata]
MSVSTALFTLLCLIHLIPTLDIVLDIRFVQPKVDEVDGGLSNVEGSEHGLILTDSGETVPNLTEQNAKDDQTPAADAAALKEKTKLADSASQCVLEAEATVERLQQDVKAANAVVVQASTSLVNTQATANAAKTAAKAAESQLNQMKNIADKIANKLAKRKKVANEAQAQLDKHTQLLKAARMRVANATRRVADAQADFDKTKEAVMRAVRRAQVQQSYGGSKMNRTGLFL